VTRWRSPRNASDLIFSLRQALADLQRSVANVFAVHTRNAQRIRKEAQALDEARAALEREKGRLLAEVESRLLKNEDDLWTESAAESTIDLTRNPLDVGGGGQGGCNERGVPSQPHDFAHHTSPLLTLIPAFTISLPRRIIRCLAINLNLIQVEAERAHLADVWKAPRHQP